MTGPRTLLLVLLSAGVAHAQAERLIPESIPAAKRKTLETYLEKLDKPKQWVPERAKWVDRTETGVQVDPNPAPPPAATPLKEYLTEVRPHKAAGKDGPEKADVYWYRPNPVKGKPGITVKRTVDLTTGQPVGDPEVLVNHAPPLAREERVDALRLAREKSPAVQALMEGVAPGDVAVTALFDQVTAKGVPDGEPGDRVVMLQFRRKGQAKVINVSVNVTRETIRERN